MITRMTKYSFVLLSEQTEDFLSKLQSLGMVDINREEKAIDQPSKELADTLTQAKQCLTRLKQVAKEKESTETEPFSGNGETLLQEASLLFTKRESLKASMTALKDQIAAARPWGAFTREDTAKIRSLGFILHAYTMPERRFRPQWEEEYPLFVVSRPEGQVYFVVLEVPGETYDFPGGEIVFPAVPWNELQQQLDTQQTELDACTHRLEILSGHMDLLKTHAGELSARLDLYLAGAGAEKQVEDHISLLTGFIPSENTAELEACLEKESLYYISEPAQTEDNPPIKLKNNWFARLFEPIGNMYMLPVYDELDLTPYFAPFYMLFFGVCLGDMGYGLLLMLLGLVGKRFLPKFRSYLNLVFFLGLGSILMASLSGSFFGMSVIDLIPAAGEKQSFFFQFTDMNMFWFAILLACSKLFCPYPYRYRLIIRKGWQHGMAPFGWAILIIWATVAYASTMIESLSLPKEASITMVVAGISLIVLFSKPEAPFSNVWDWVSGLCTTSPGIWRHAFLHTFVWSGASGGILGMVINTLALSLSGIPYVGWLLTIVLLLFGHALVLA